jgi:hypothetical protein
MMMSSARQQDNEPFAEYHTRFTSCVDVAESKWGTPVPTAAAINETNEKTSRDKFITCSFNAGVDTKRYGKLKLPSAVTMLSHYMNDKGVHMKDEDKGQTDKKSFMHKHKNVTCYKCGKKGHYANKCPEGDNNEEVSQLDQVPATTAGLTALDGVATMMVSHYSKREA